MRRGCRRRSVRWRREGAIRYRRRRRHRCRRRGGGGPWRGGRGEIVSWSTGGRGGGGGGARGRPAGTGCTKRLRGASLLCPGPARQ
ncbi:MAG: hypothetical protein EA398_00005 [Deltaproteobacteria bacterium]|nr:MAG: hypothetical protein EA398_00005 [Deltaproteobacteria bacterium]